MVDSPGGQEVGRVSIRVLPDTSRFKADLLAYLRELEQTVKANIEVEADTSGFSRETTQAKERAEKDSVKVRVDPITREFAAKVRRDLAAIAKTTAAHIPVEADTEQLRREVAAKIVEIEQTLEADISVDLGLSTAARAKLQGEIKSLEERVDAEIPVDADTSPASRQVAVWRQWVQRNPVNLSVRADRNELRRALSGISGALSGALGGVLRGVGVGLGASLLGGLSVGAIGSAINGVTQLVSVLWSLVGVAGLVPGVLAGIVGVLGAVVVGTRGMGTALQALSQAEQSSGASAAQLAKTRATAARAVEQAQRGVEDAVRRADDAAVDGARRVIAAEKALASAQRDARRAQEDLNRAREEAADTLEDLQLELDGAALDEEGALIALNRARMELARTINDGDSTGQDRAEASHRVREAEHQLKVIKDRNEELRESADEARRAGVDGAEAVVDAQERAVDAADAVREAEENLARTREDALRDQLDAQRAISDAQDRLADAQEQLNEATGKGSTEQQKALDLLAKLSPAGAAVVTTLWGLREAWAAVRREVQESLFVGIAPELEDVAGRLLPGLQSGLSGVARELNLGIRGFFEWLKSDTTAATFSQTWADIAASIALLRPAIEPFWTLLADLVGASASFLPRLAAGFAQVVTGWSLSMDQAIQDGSFDAWVNTGIEAAKTLGEVLWNLGSILNSVFGASNEASGGFLVTLRDLTGRVSEFLNTPEGHDALVSFFSALRDISAALWPVFKTIGTVLAKDIAPVLAELVVAAAPGLVVFLEALGQAFRELAPVAGPLGASLGELFRELAPILPELGRTLAIVLPELVATVREILQALMPALMSFLAWVRDNPDLFVKMALAIWAIVSAIQAIIPLLPVLLPLMKGLVGVAQALMVPLGWLAANPIVIGIIAAIALAIVNMILAIKWFERVWNDIWKPVWDALWQVLEEKVIPKITQFHQGLTNLRQWIIDRGGDIAGFFGRVASAIFENFRGAFNGIADLWNNTVGTLDFTIPDWVGFGLGGKGWRAPQIPKWYPNVSAFEASNGAFMFHQGGVVPGPPDSDVPAILQAGEWVLSTDQVAALLGGQIDYEKLADAVARRPVLLDGVRVDRQLAVTGEAYG